MDKHKLLILLSNRKVGFDELVDVSLEDLLWCRQQTEKEEKSSIVSHNFVLLVKAIRTKIKDIPLYCIKISTGFPYQESTLFGKKQADCFKITARLFATKDKADAFCMEINKMHNKKNKDNEKALPDIAMVELLGYRLGIDAMAELQHYGVDLVVFGDKLNEEITAIKMGTLTPVDETVNYFAVAPKVQAMQGLRQQAIAEGRPDAEIEGYAEIIAASAAVKHIACAITKEDYEENVFNPVQSSYNNGMLCVDVFSDWNELEKLYPNKNLYIVICDWNTLSEMGVNIAINGDVVLTKSAVYKLGAWTENAIIAKTYIAHCYNVHISSSSLATNLEDKVFNEIRKAAPIYKEFLKGLHLAQSTNEKGELVQYAEFVFPKESEVEPISVKGKTAQSLFETKLCKHPAAAYHVLAQLYNDKDGSVYEKFMEAELYE